jgi:predicted PurR-regulated permease PerM
VTILRGVEAGCILALLAVYFSYIVAPAIDAVSRRVRLGRRRRPLSRPWAILLVYIMLLTGGALTWRLAAPLFEEWVQVTAPAAIERAFAATDVHAVIERFYGRVPLPGSAKLSAVDVTTRSFGYVEAEVRAALGDGIDAAPHVRWLALSPVAAFVLLAYAPAFRRSALRLLPHGHLSWRGEEYLRDVNSALAGYVRAQLTAGVIIGLECAAVFSLVQLPYAVSMGVVAGVLELVPVLGPLTVIVVAMGQAGHQALVVMALLLGVRLVQDLVVYPRLVRKGMHLSSAAVIVVVWCGAALDGAAGVVLAIPFAGFISVSVRHWREYRAIERLVRNAPPARRE